MKHLFLFLLLVLTGSALAADDAGPIYNNETIKFKEEIFVGKNTDLTGGKDIAKFFSVDVQNAKYDCELIAFSVPAESDAFLRKNRELIIKLWPDESSPTSMILLDEKKNQVVKFSCNRNGYNNPARITKKLLESALSAEVKTKKLKRYDIKYQDKKSEDKSGATTGT